MWVALIAFVMFAGSQESALVRAGHAAESFWQEFSMVQCKERVAQTKFNMDGKSVAIHAEDFDYVALLKAAATGGLAVEESRVSRGERTSGQHATLLLTSGFSTFLLMFHPEFRDRFEFEEIPMNRIAFRSKSEAPSMSALKLKDRLYPILWKGTATVDPESGAPRRIDAALSTPMDDLGLSAIEVQVDYAPVKLPGASKTFWLPARATVSLKTPRQGWRNVHEFSDYKRFLVTTEPKP